MKNTSTELVVIFGYGAVGKATAERLIAQGRNIRVAQRKPPADLPTEAQFISCDVLDAHSVLTAADGASQIVVSIGFEYSGKVWQNSWPKAMRNLLSACETTGARMVFLDNLYMYGPQNAPLHEDMPLSDYPRKPAARSAITRMWQDASAAGRVKVAALRPPDFYGPGVTQSHLGDQAFVPLANGKSAALACNPAMPHDFAYVPDIARAIVTLLDAPDLDFGQAWHMPCAPTLTPQQIISLGAEAVGVKPRIQALPAWLLPILGLFVPFLRELHEMRFQWNAPYLVDAEKFKRRFWSDVTPFEVGVKATALSFQKSTK